MIIACVIIELKKKKSVKLCLDGELNWSREIGRKREKKRERYLRLSTGSELLRMKTKGLIETGAVIYGVFYYYFILWAWMIFACTAPGPIKRKCSIFIFFLSNFVIKYAHTKIFRLFILILYFFYLWHIYYRYFFVIRIIVITLSIKVK